MYCHKTRWLAHLPFKMRKSGHIDDRLYFMQPCHTVTIRVRSAPLTRAYPQRCPQVRWSDRTPGPDGPRFRRNAPVARVESSPRDQRLWKAGISCGEGDVTLLLPR
jgi:hypothetical protein